MGKLLTKFVKQINYPIEFRLHHIGLDQPAHRLVNSSRWSQGNLVSHGSIVHDLFSAPHDSRTTSRPDCLAKSVTLSAAGKVRLELTSCSTPFARALALLTS